MPPSDFPIGGPDLNMKSEKESLECTLEKIANSRRLWICWIFVLTASPGILNGMHVTAYVFLIGDDAHYCRIPELEMAGWTPQQIQNVSFPMTYSENSHLKGCSYVAWNYSYLAQMNFTDAVSYTKSLNNSTPKARSCEEYRFEENDTVTSQWNLICDRFHLRSNVQSFFALGKFCGAFIFGVIADKVGRKRSFTLAAIIYMISAPLAAFLNSYYMFLLARFIIGFAGVGCYGTAYTLLTEIIMGAARNGVCCLYNVSYPIGMIILTFLAYNIPSWRLLQIVMSLPTLLLPLNAWLLPESPNWLLSQGRNDDAWKQISKIDGVIGKPDGQFVPYEKKSSDVWEGAWYVKLKGTLQKCYHMFSTTELLHRSLICCFIWFTSSLTYYGLVINGTNLNIDRYLYVLLNGILEIVGYGLPVPLLRRFGRKFLSLILLLITGLSLLSILLIPRSMTGLILAVALIGRCCCSSVFVVFALHTAELFPTTVRNTAIGTSLTASHIGTIAAPYIVDILGYYRWYIPSTIFGIFAILACLVIIPLPETKNQPLYNSVEEIQLS